jgi:predicted nuclease of predicted toxin-antitoxin system
MRFLVDAQLPPVLARWFEDRGYEASAARDVGLRDAKDSAIWNFALLNDSVLVTKDEDFAVRATQSDGVPQVVWLRIGNCTNRVLFAWLEPLLPGIVDALRSGNRLVEVQHSRT